MRNLRFALVCGLTAAWACAPAGVGDPRTSGELAEVSVALTVVPAMVTCIKVQPVINGTATAPVLTTVAANASSAAIGIGRLAAGAATFAGAAFALACTDATINTTAVPTWIADPVSATLSAGVPTTISMTFRQNNPVVVSANFVKGATSLATGLRSSYAVMSDGTVKAWGSTMAGIGTVLVPTDLPGATGVVQVVAGNQFGCLRTTAGAVQCWGTLPGGNGTSVPTPTAVTLPGPALKIASGVFHVCAIVKISATNNPIYCWGSNGAGQLGDGTVNDSATPVQVQNLSASVYALGVGGATTCAITTEPLVKCWGNAGAGQLGNGTSPIEQHTPVTAQTVTAIKDVVVGSRTVCALGVDSRVQCWGTTPGDGTPGNLNTPVFVAGLSDAIDVGIGAFHICAAKSSGSVVCWGRNLQGQTALPAETQQLVPGQPISGFAAPVVDISAHDGSHTCALLQGGAVSCWGANESGQLGDGTIMNRWMPVPALIN